MASTPTPAHDRLGCTAKDLIRDQEVQGTDLIFLRKTSGKAEPMQVRTDDTGQGYIVGLSLMPGHWRDIRQGRQVTRAQFVQDSIYIRDFDRPYTAELSGRFDFLLIEIPSHVIAPQDDEPRFGNPRRLTCEAGTVDPTIGHLMRAVLPVLGGREPVERLFLDQMGEALCTYLRRRYANSFVDLLTTPPPSALISRALEILRANLDGDIGLDQIASLCRVSRSYFYEAFRKELGCTPHEWVMRQRLERAQALLTATRMPLSEIAQQCGFADQSHLTRQFSRRLGISPARWRAQAAS
ncbi:helix-turn-helix domain-containing protein [Pannonibacter tanglangensis]|uniref:Helix-turn-helix domain-containing protein n=1 Tax=Pannonibacter tanglangensis TaxID=2750084 RepID=A0ABW9ZLQ4_9HYPH|nr:AraC family transcriptional regulator [Pannonibacter sp. XCT-34]NBN64822.1 helix-turn-helix domain-containing protein [Pannonibacter sp. XCT-34]